MSADQSAEQVRYDKTTKNKDGVEIKVKDNLKHKDDRDLCYLMLKGI